MLLTKVWKTHFLWLSSLNTAYFMPQQSPEGRSTLRLKLTGVAFGKKWLHMHSQCLKFPNNAIHRRQNKVDEKSPLYGRGFYRVCTNGVVIYGIRNWMFLSSRPRGQGLDSASLSFHCCGQSLGRVGHSLCQNKGTPAIHAVWYAITSWRLRWIGDGLAVGSEVGWGGEGVIWALFLSFFYRSNPPVHTRD